MRCWKRSSEILIHIDPTASRSRCRFVGRTSMMQLSRSTTSQRCSIRLRSGDCGGHWSTVNKCNVQETSLRWFELGNGALSCWKEPSEDGYTVVIKGWTWSAKILRLSLAVRSSPTPFQQPEPLIIGRMDPCFYVVYTKFWSHHLNVAAEIETHRTRPRFPIFSCNFGEPVWTVASVSCSYPTGVAPGPQGLTCWTLRDCIRHTLVVTSGWVTVALLSSWTHFLWLLTSTRHFRPQNCRSLDIFSFWTILRKPYKWLCVKIPTDQQYFWNTPTTMWCSESLDSPFFLILMLSLNFSKSSRCLNAIELLPCDWLLC